MGKLIEQAGAIPYRISGGRVEVLLVTSRETGRWVIPKGHVDKGATASQAAALEALEEAGVSGRFASDLPLGFVPYFKTLKDGEVCAATIQVFALLVHEERTAWLESGERRRQWMPAREAARRVGEPALAMLLTRLAELNEDSDQWPVAGGG
jgi:8-oxo-dGTP pyrophosphatase MutT (NUDIX family)